MGDSPLPLLQEHSSYFHTFIATPDGEPVCVGVLQTEEEVRQFIEAHLKNYPEDELDQVRVYVVFGVSLNVNIKPSRLSVSMTPPTLDQLPAPPS